jgi:hypothetical protein
MADQTERGAHLLMWAMYRATDGERRWWGLPTKLNDLTKEAIAFGVDRGWMLHRGDSVCLTDVGRDLVEEGGSGAIGELPARLPAKAEAKLHHRLAKRDQLASPGVGEGNETTS